LRQLEHLQDSGVEFVARINHGPSHSAYIVDPEGQGIEVLYELPPEVCEGDVNASFHYAEILPVNGPDVLQDDTDYPIFTSP